MSRSKLRMLAVAASLPVVLLAVPVGTAGEKNPRQQEPAKKSSKASEKKEQVSIAEAARRARAQEPLSPALRAARKKTEDGDTKIVITNEVLERMFGASRAAPKSPDYGDFVREDGNPKGKKGASGDGKGQSTAPVDPAKRAEELRAEIDRLHKRLLGLRNPYLPRGKATEEERELEEGKDNTARVKMIEEKIDRLEQELLSLSQNKNTRR